MQLINKTVMALIILICAFKIEAQHWVKSAELSILSGSVNLKNTHVQNNRVYLESMQINDDSIIFNNKGKISSILTRKFAGDNTKIVHRAISILNEDMTYIRSVAIEGSILSTVNTDYSGLNGVGVYVSGYL